MQPSGSRAAPPQPMRRCAPAGAATPRKACACIPRRDVSAGGCRWGVPGCALPRRRGQNAVCFSYPRAVKYRGLARAGSPSTTARIIIKRYEMAESLTQAGKRWVTETFERVGREYQDQMSVQRVHGWRIGNTPEKSSPEGPNTNAQTYYLAFEVEHITKPQYMTFDRGDLDDCASPENAESRVRLERYIRECFDYMMRQ